MTDLQMICERGLKKINTAKNDPIKFLWSSILAGFFLGAAMILSYTLGALYADNTAVSKTLVAFTFGIGLVCIVFMNAELFTGNCLTTIIPIYHKRAKIRDLLPAWIICYIGNMLGICLIGFFFIISQQDGTLFEKYLAPVTETKLTFTILPLLMKAILCNFIVCMASFAWHKVEKDGTKIIIMMLLVAAFVIAGLEHCVANWGFFSMAFTQYGFSFDWSQFPMHMLIASIGNMIGGSILLGYPLYQIMKKEK